MNTKERLYAAIGGCVGAVLTMVVCAFLPVGVQSQGDNFGEIICTGLKVVRPDGSVGVELDASIGVSVWGGEEHIALAFLGVDEYGGEVFLAGRKASAKIGSGAHGGFVQVWGKNESSVVMKNDERGGMVEVTNNQGKTVGLMSVYKGSGRAKVFDDSGVERDGGAVSLRIDEHGGKVIVFGKKMGGGQASVGVSENGGLIGVFGKGNSETRAALGVNKYGNGAVSTWDKNGYRLK